MNTQRVFYQTPDGRLIPAATNSHSQEQSDKQEQEEQSQPNNQRSLWQQQLSDKGYALCPNDDCGLACLTLGGMAGHFKSCSAGQSYLSSSVDCPVCSVKFTTYTSMSTHMARAHYSAAAARAEEETPEQEVWSPQPGTSKQRTTAASAAASRQEQFLPHSVLDDLDNSPSQSSESPAAQAARIMAESRKISYARRPGRPRKSRRTPPPNQSIQYSDPFDIMKDPQLQQQLVLNHVPLPQEPQIVFQESPLRASARVMSLDGQPQRKRSRVDADSSTSDGEQQLQQQHYVVIAPAAEGQATIPGAGVRVIKRSASASASTEQLQSKSGDESGLTDDSDFEERERRLAEEEERLREYERLVLQSEKVAATESRRAKIREREKMVMRKKEELRKRLADAVQTIEAIKTEHVDITDDDEEEEQSVAAANEGAANEASSADESQKVAESESERQEEVLPDDVLPANAEEELILPVTVANEELLQEAHPVAQEEEEEEGEGEEQQREEEVVINHQQPDENASQGDGGEAILPTTDEGVAANESITAEEGEALVSTEYNTM